MRELKFRVWGLYEKQYAYIDEENQAGSESFWDRSCIAVLDKKHIVDCWTDEDGEGEGNEYCDVKEVEAIEQYTGLKDKNSKEIYEGDILSAFGNYYNVVFESVRAGFVAKRIDGSKDDFFAGYFGKYLVKNCEVIGNIHEDQELLESKDGESR